jgi:hypothetical protein
MASSNSPTPNTTKLSPSPLSTATTGTNNVVKPLNSLTLSKALTKPPPLSAVLNNPSTSLLQQRQTLTVASSPSPPQPSTLLNGGSLSATHSLSSSPSPFQQASSLLQTQPSSLSSNQSINNGSDLLTRSFQQQQQPSQMNFSNSLPPNPTTSDLFKNANKPFYQINQPSSTPSFNNSSSRSNQQAAAATINSNPSQLSTSSQIPLHAPTSQHLNGPPSFALSQQLTSQSAMAPPLSSTSFNQSMPTPPPLPSSSFSQSMPSAASFNQSMPPYSMLNQSMPPITSFNQSMPPPSFSQSMSPPPALNNAIPPPTSFVPSTQLQPQPPTAPVGTTFQSQPPPNRAGANFNHPNSLSASQPQQYHPPTDQTMNRMAAGPPPLMPTQTSYSGQIQQIGPPLPMSGIQPPPMNQSFGGARPPMMNGPAASPTQTSQYMSGPASQQQQQPMYQAQSAPPPPLQQNNRPVQQQQQQQMINQFNNMSLSATPQQSQQPQPQQQHQQFGQQQSHPMNNLQNRSQPQAIDLLREKKLIMPFSNESEEPPRPLFPNEFFNSVNCHAE